VPAGRHAPPGLTPRETPVLSPAQCRAARAILGWTQAILAERAGLARKTIADFEMNLRNLQYRTRRDITLTFQAAGIEFLWERDAQGGVRNAAAGSEIEGLRYVPSVAA
jgi:DNA-binding XRE family transcriptional regulator